VSEEWICTECEYPYHEPPEECSICGNQVVVPRDEYEARMGGVEGALKRARGRLLRPMTADRNLLGGGRFVRVAFLVITVLTAVLLLVLAASLLLG
jgi:hypothetical protein